MGQSSLTVLLLDEFHLCADQIGIRGDQIQIGKGSLLDHLPEPRTVEQGLIDRPIGLFFAEADTAR